MSAVPVRDLLPGKEVPLGESTRVRRLLPSLGRRMIGAWCFVDHYGPDDIADQPGMQVPPHPHMGLQTVSWLHDGEILHRDSLGSRQVLRPRQLGLMTSGDGLSHAEQSPAEHPRILHGAQLWVALPDEARRVTPAWEFHPTLPEVTMPGLTATVILGDFDTVTSPGTTHSPLVGLDIHLRPGTRLRLPVEPDFEYGALAMSPGATVDGVPLGRSGMLYLGAGRNELPVHADADCRFMLLGGEPFAERIVMWWNFVGRTGADITRARQDWVDRRRFGGVTDYRGDRLTAPPLPPTPLLPRGRQR